MQSGGGPFQIYLLYKNGVSVGKSVAITLVRTLQVIFLLALIIPFSIVSEAAFIEKTHHAEMVRYLCASVYSYCILPFGHKHRQTSLDKKMEQWFSGQDEKTRDT